MLGIKPIRELYSHSSYGEKTLNRMKENCQSTSNECSPCKRCICTVAVTVLWSSRRWIHGKNSFSILGRGSCTQNLLRNKKGLNRIF